MVSKVVKKDEVKGKNREEESRIFERSLGCSQTINLIKTKGRKMGLCSKVI